MTDSYWSVRQMAEDMTRAADWFTSALECRQWPTVAAGDLRVGRLYLSIANDIAVELGLFSGRVQ